MAEIVIDDPDVDVDLLAEYEQLFRTVFERSDEGIIISEPDVNGHLIQVNQAAADLHDYTIDEMLKLKASDLHLEGEDDGARKGMEMMLRGEWVENVHDHRRKDGSTFPAHFRAGSVLYQGRRVIISFVRDVTEEQQMEHDLALCQTELTARL